jgi:hypothetical protein
MTAALVTSDEVKRALRIDLDDTDDDALIEQLIYGATKMVINYLKSAADAYLDSGGDVPSGTDIPDEIKTATIMLVGFLFKQSDQDPEGYFERGYLPKPVTAILYPLRDPALA